MHFYGQVEEDKLLYNNYFKDKKNGTYIELGAIDGVDFTNTKFFEDTLNWTGILIEPNPNMFKYLKQHRPNNFLFNDLVSCDTEELKFKYFIEGGDVAVSGVESSLTEYHEQWFCHKKELQRTILIKPKTLTEIVKSTNITHIDFLSLDVEGHELEVLKSWDFSIPIDLILIEILGVDHAKEEKCRELLHNNNYIFKERFHHNEIYVLNTSPYN